MQTCNKKPCYAKSATANGKPITYCYPCGRELTEGSESADSAELTEYTEVPDPNAYDGPEKTLVEAIRRAVEARGGTVFRIAQRGGFGSGTDKGCSDTFISIASDKTLYRSIEVKPKGKPLTPEQKENVRKGVMFVARSVERALFLCGYE